MYTPRFVSEDSTKRTRRSWDAMKQRCSNPKAPKYSRYGGRGICYQPSWESFSVFLTDMGERPEGTTLERKDNDGNYCKENCTWATPAEQRANQGVYAKQTKARVDSTSGVLGLSFISSAGKWRAYCNVDGKRKSLYYGVSREKALKARQDWEASQSE